VQLFFNQVPDQVKSGENGRDFSDFSVHFTLKLPIFAVIFA